MAIKKPKISSIVASQLPEFVRDEYQTFVDFLKAYYEFLENTQEDPVTLKDLDTTLDSFITYFKSELAQKLPYSTVDERFLLTRIKDLYLAKGSESSFRLLFRILFNKEIEIDYPSTQMLRASDGKWNQDVSVFVKILVGNPQDIVGKLVDVVTTTKVIRVLVDRRQYVEVEVDRAIRISDNVYEFILDRRFFGTVSVGDTLRYLDNNNNLVFNGIILPTTSALVVEKPGTGFKVGDLYNITNFNGYGTILKVAAVDASGGIAQGQFIKYGIGYTTDFSSSITSQKGQDLSSSIGTIINRVDTATTTINLQGTLSVTNNSTTVTGTSSFFTTEVAAGDYLFLPNGYYTVSSVTNNTTLVLTSAYLGTTQSSLSTIQRARPGGGLRNFVKLGIAESMAGFSESGSINTADYNLPVTTTLTGTLTATNGSPTVTGSGTLFSSQVAYGDYLTLGSGTYIVSTVNSDTSITLSSNYTGTTSSSLTSVSNLRPAGIDGTYAGLTIREFGISSVSSVTTVTEPAIIRVSLGSLAKYPGYYVTNDGFLDDAVYIQDSRYYQAFSYVIKIDQSLNTYKTIVKNLIHPSGMAIFGEYDLRNEFTINTAIESLIKILSITVNDTAKSGTNLEIKDISKTINSVVYDHYLNNGYTLDDDTVSPIDIVGTDLNRTLPYFNIQKPLGTQPTYAGATEDSTAAPTDSGGIILFNPYGEAGFFLNDSGSYVGVPSTF